MSGKDRYNFQLIDLYVKFMDNLKTNQGDEAAFDALEQQLQVQEIPEFAPPSSSPSYPTQSVQQVYSSPTTLFTATTPTTLHTTATTTTSRQLPAFLRSDSEARVQNIMENLMAETEVTPIPTSVQPSTSPFSLGSTFTTTSTTSINNNTRTNHHHPHSKIYIAEAATAGCTVVDKNEQLDHRLGETIDFQDMYSNFYDDCNNPAASVVKMEEPQLSPDWSTDHSRQHTGFGWAEDTSLTELVPAAPTEREDLEIVLECLQKDGLDSSMGFDIYPVGTASNPPPSEQQHHQQQQRQSFINLTSVSNLTSAADDARVMRQQPSVSPSPALIPPSVSPAPSITDSISSSQSSSSSSSSADVEMFYAQQSPAAEDDFTFLESLADFTKSDLPQSVTPARTAPSPSPSTTSSTSSSSSSSSSSQHRRSTTRSSNKQIRLWEFLKELLDTNDPSMKWIDRATGVFKIENSTRVARRWGERKNHPAMNYDKLSRSIRQYYKKNIIKKTQSTKRLVYQFYSPYL